MKPPLSIALIAASPAIVGGHSVQAVALASQLTAGGDHVMHVPIDCRFPRGFRWLRAIPYVRTIVNELLYILSLRALFRADVVHVFSASYWSFMLGPVPAIAVARLLRKPVVLHYHSGEADDHLRRWRRTVKIFFGLADEIAVPSTYLQRIFASHGYSACVIPNGIDTTRFVYRERLVAQPHLLCARNLERHYGVHTVIEAFATLVTRFPGATLVIAGSGSEERHLRRLARGIDGIHFVGSVKPEDMPRIYDAAEIFVNASVVDNQPVSILEAFASGLPVVSTATGDIPSMLRHGEAGILVDQSLANAIARLLDEPGLSLDLARRAREEAERHAWPRVAAQWSALYADLMSVGAKEALAHGA